MKSASHLKDEVALLAPIPECHLKSAAEIIGEMSKVAFGTNAYELFVELDAKKQQNVEVFIYASHTVTDGLPIATWHGRYVRCVNSNKVGQHPDNEEYRPPSAREEDKPGPNAWPCFWEVADLHELSPAQQIPIHEFFGFRKTKRYKKGFVPQGPLLVHYP